jgi:type IV secretion system protein VirB10
VTDAAPGLEQAVAGGRGPAVVGRGRSLQAKVQNALAIVVVMGVGGAFLAWYYSGLAETRAAAVKPKPAVVQGEMKLPPLGPAPQPAKPLQETPLIEEDSPEADALLDGTTPANEASGEPAGEMGPPAAESYAATSASDPALARKLGSPVLVQGLGSYSMPESAAPEIKSDAALDGPQADRPGSGSSGAGPAGGTELAGMLRPTVTAATTAGVLPDRRWLLPKGAFIDCTLETAIDSTLPGMTSCVTATDMWSADGSVVLLERGTKLVGETRSGVAQGQRRLFVLWNEARTPKGVTVELASPGADALGRSGITGEVDTHFAARFGAAILVSLIDAAAAAVVAAQSDGSGSVVIAPQGASDVMSEVLRSTVNIPPTIRVNQGERVAVLVARDVSFDEVYALAHR